MEALREFLSPFEKNLNPRMKGVLELSKMQQLLIDIEVQELQEPSLYKDLKSLLTPYKNEDFLGMPTEEKAVAFHRDYTKAVLQAEVILLHLEVRQQLDVDKVKHVASAGEPSIDEKMQNPEAAKQYLKEFKITNHTTKEEFEAYAKVAYHWRKNDDLNANTNVEILIAGAKQSLPVAMMIAESRFAQNIPIEQLRLIKDAHLSVPPELVNQIDFLVVSRMQNFAKLMVNSGAAQQYLKDFKITNHITEEELNMYAKVAHHWRENESVGIHTNVEILIESAKKSLPVTEMILTSRLVHKLSIEQLTLIQAAHQPISPNLHNLFGVVITHKQRQLQDELQKEVKQTVEEIQKAGYTPYSLLGLHPGESDPRLIKLAFNQKSLQYHPDTTALDKAKAKVLFDLVKKAHAILINPQAKAALDASLEAPSIPLQPRAKP